MNNIAKVAIASLFNISSAYADSNSITMTCISTYSPSTTYNITYFPELNYTEIVGNWINASSRLYKVLGKDTKGNIIYLRTKAEGQKRTVYLAFGYSDAGDDVSAIRVIDKRINYDKRDRCYIQPQIKPSQPSEEASSSPAKPESQVLSPDIKKTIQEAIAMAVKKEAEAAAEKAREFRERAERKEAEKREQAEGKEKEAEAKREEAERKEKEAEANREWREKIEEANRKGREYAQKAKSIWSLIEINNPMTDGKDYRVKSTQINGEGAVAEIEGTCKESWRSSVYRGFKSNIRPRKPYRIT